MPERGEELHRVRLEKRARLLAQGVHPYPPRWPRTHTTRQAVDLFLEAEARMGPSARSEPVRVAGRVTALRRMGGASFVDLRDGEGRIQAHLRQDLLGDRYDFFLDFVDLGDFLGVEGPVFRTRRGEVTVEAHDLALLCKALRPPPEKWHGLRDVETRLRHRELDLMASEAVRQRFRLRSLILRAVRRFLDERGFLEVETPILVPVPAGAMARPFVTHHHALNRDLYLRIATELHLKRCVVGGLERVYEIGRVFRNEGIDARHNPEFTTLEAYQAYADYHEMMRLAEDLVATVAQEVLGTLRLTWQGQEIDLTPPWRRLSLRDAIRDFTGIDLDTCREAEALAARMRELGIATEHRTEWGRLVDKLLAEAVEPRLIQPTFLVDYPREMSPLAKEKPEDPRYVERFEAFIGGMEIANAFTELNDPVEQRRRFEEQEEMRRRHGDEEYDRLDEDFLLALEHGMPPTGGIGIGIDRLVMLLTDQPTIREVVLFPQLRTLRPTP